MYQQNAPIAPGQPFPWAGPIDKLPSAFRTLVGGSAYQFLRSSYGIVKHELTARPGVPVGRRLAMWRRGFFAESAVLYDLPRNPAADYVSDFARALRLREVNARPELFAHKLALRAYLLAMGIPQPETLAVIYDGRARVDVFSDGATYVSAEELARRLTAADGDYIVKPEDGTWGDGLFMLSARGGRLSRRRGRDAEPFDLPAYVAERRAADGTSRMTLVERRLRQSAFAAALFPESGNTIRVLTLWTPGETGPFIARAVQRVGTADTVPTDNWSGGGISARVDLETGALGVGRMHPLKGTRRETHFTHHPDTGAPIAGAVIPEWASVRRAVLQAAISVPFNRMVGWDVLVAADGAPVLLEANTNSDVNLLQVHGGLLAEPRVRRFYASFGAA